MRWWSTAGATARGRPVVERLLPEPDDYCVLKPKHSASYSTSLDVLLASLQAQTPILTGIAGDHCVLFTAHDGFLRDSRRVVPAACLASLDPASDAYTLGRLRDVLEADLTPSDALDLAALARRAPLPPGPRVP